MQELDKNLLAQALIYSNKPRLLCAFLSLQMILMPTTVWEPLAWQEVMWAWSRGTAMGLQGENMERVTKKSDLQDWI